MLQHPFAPVGCHDTVCYAVIPPTAVARVPQSVGHAVLVGMIHRAGVEGGDLVIVDVRRNERLRSVSARNPAHVALRQAELLEPLGIRRVVVPDCRHDERIAAEHAEAVRDIARASTELAPHVRHEKSDVEDVQLVRKDVILEAIAEHHDGVVRDRTADECAHGARDYTSTRNHTVGTLMSASMTAALPMSFARFAST